MTYFASDSLHPSITKRNTDVLCGRGGGSNNHLGNHIYRRIVNENKETYQTCKTPSMKQCIVLSIIVAIQRNGGRFIEQGKDGIWQEISSKKAIIKTSQALREQKDHRDKSRHIKSNSNPLLATKTEKQPSSIAPETLSRKISDNAETKIVPIILSERSASKEDVNATTAAQEPTSRDVG